MSTSVRMAPALAALGITCAASTVQAFCRTTTEDPPSSTCPATCLRVGTPLYWLTPEIEYALNERGFPGIPEARLREILAASFRTWEDVLCGDQPVGLLMTQQPQTSALEEGPMDDEPNSNVVVHYDGARWIELDHSPYAFAVTTVWFAESGRIYGADLLFNGGMGPFGDCSQVACGSPGAPTVDLQNVATHEIGHFFGLNHSGEQDSTMFCGADAGEMLKRTLEADDIEGLCEAYPPGLAFTEPRRKEGGCALADGSCDLSALALLASLMRRRQRVTPSTRKP